MGICACLIAVLLEVSSAGVGELPGTQADVLVAADPVLADVGQLAVVLAAEEAGQVGSRVDAPRLRADVVKKLNAAGIRLVENEAALDPRLSIHVEGIVVPGAETYVCRVQTALDRVATFPGRKDVQARAQVWRAKPMMEAVAPADAGKRVEAAVLAQVEAFVAACQAAHQPARLTNDDKPTGPAPEALPPPSRVESFPLAPGEVCVASRGGSVFHRSTCRLARKITAGNLISYRSRLDALQAGLRPCRSCKP